jgi:hypothetical protein
MCSFVLTDRLSARPRSDAGTDLRGSIRHRADDLGSAEFPGKVIDPGSSDEIFFASTILLRSNPAIIDSPITPQPMKAR